MLFLFGRESGFRFVHIRVVVVAIVVGCISTECGLFCVLGLRMFAVLEFVYAEIAFP